VGTLAKVIARKMAGTVTATGGLITQFIGASQINVTIGLAYAKWSAQATARWFMRKVDKKWSGDA
jgi:hypothetical protein